MRKKKPYKRELVVSEEAIDDFVRLSSSQRLRWLDEMRGFLDKTLPKRVKQNWDRTWDITDPPRRAG